MAQRRLPKHRSRQDSASVAGAALKERRPNGPDEARPGPDPQLWTGTAACRADGGGCAGRPAWDSLDLDSVDSWNQRHL
nr:hypothetical protein OG461_14000 [Streptomyces sp. NBC_00995]